MQRLSAGEGSPIPAGPPPFSRSHVIPRQGVETERSRG